MNQTIQPTELAHAARLAQSAPPPRYLRQGSAAQLYVAMPELGRLTVARPRSAEPALNYFNRLRVSATPEDAVTFAAFAPLPQMAIWWGHESLRLLPAALSGDDSKLLEQIGRWVGAPDARLRHWIMRRALWAETRTPTVLLGLAAGWSGGALAPNDPEGVAQHRCPSAINSAVLGTLAKVPSAQRADLRDHILDLADCLFRAP
jgi:hypothetical protein